MSKPTWAFGAGLGPARVRMMTGAPDCSHKRAYESEYEAQRVAEHQMGKTPGLELRVYECDGCEKYHLTSKP